MPRYCLRLFLLGAALLTCGCATALTKDAISPGNEEDEFDYVADVTAAYRDAAGNVTLCVTGRPAGTNSWLGGTRNYSIVYPGASSPEPMFALHEDIPIYDLTVADVKGACPPPMQGMAPISVHTVYGHEFRNTPSSVFPNRGLSTFLENYSPVPAVYMYRDKIDTEIFSGDVMKLYYTRETPFWDDIRTIEIPTRYR